MKKLLPSTDTIPPIEYFGYNYFSLRDSIPVLSNVNISSDYIFDGNEGPYYEDSDPKPLNYYGITKLEAERIIEEEREWNDEKNSDNRI